MTYYPHPGTARVLVDAEQVGFMNWAEDGRNEIDVWGEGSAVDDIAAAVAGDLGGTFAISDL